MFLLELFHKIGQGLAAFFGDGIVNGRPAAADGPMAFDTDEVVFGCFGDELCFQFLRRQVEGDIHQAARILAGMAAVEAVAVVDDAVDNGGFLLIAFIPGLQSAVVVEPVSYFIDEINIEHRRRIVCRIVVDIGLILQHERQIAADLIQQVVLDDGDDDAGRTDVLLDTGIDEIEILHIYRAAEKIAGHITEQRNVERRKIMPFRPMDGIVRCHVNIVRIGLDDEAVCLGDVRKVIGFTRSDFIGFPEEGSRFHGLVGPYPGIQITAAFLEEIGRVHCDD